MSQGGYRITIVSHTHWDRAWYVTFQEFRARLVRLVDRLLKLLQSQPGYRVFMLDGQMAVLEDYLEVRPQRQPEIEALCRAGRLKVGPWYVLADEFLVHPEALIQNMRLGIKMGADYGGVSQVGYVPDGFGHIAQLPQIFRGFGIDNAFFWRGVGAEGERLGTEFAWQAPDGSEVTAIWLPLGYHNISNVGYPIHWGDVSQMAFDSELALEQMSKAVAALAPRAHTPSLLLMNGIDHEEAEPRIPEVVALANRALTEGEFVHGSLEDHVRHVRAAHPALPVFSGEFRWGKYSEVLQGVYATRLYLKQANHRVENLLIGYAGPLSAFAWLSGAEIPEGTPDLLWTAWKWLLKNHPHDDLYGSGIDAVHDEMLYRFSQAEQIGQIIVRDSLRQLARQVDFTAQAGMPVLVFNPLGWERHEIAVGDLDFDFDDPAAESFQMVDEKGRVVPHQALEDRQLFWLETLKANRKRRVRVAFWAEVPACGYAAYFVRAAPKALAPEIPPGLQVFPDGAANDFLEFRIASDGGLTLTDKLSGQVYPGLHHFEDVEDAGDEYSYSPASISQTVSSQGRAAAIRLATRGPNLVTFEVRYSLPVPLRLSQDRRQRAEEAIELAPVARFTLYRGQPGLSVETDLNNRAEDHKLSVTFPTPFNPQTAAVHEAFAVVQREIDLPDSAGWVEDPTPLMHQRTFTDLSDGHNGLAVLNRGLPAVEVTRQAEGAQVSLTLLRCVGWLSRTDLSTRRIAAGPLPATPGAQCPGPAHFEYAIYPHRGDWEAVYPTACQYDLPLLVTRADTHEGLELREMNITRDDPAKVRAIPWPRQGPLPGRAAFLETNAPELVLSAIHRTEDGQGWLARYYNITARPIHAEFRALGALAEVWQVNLNETRLARIGLINAHRFEAQVGAAQIVSFELRPQRTEAERP